MELELRLALPFQNGLDLNINSYAIEPNECVKEGAGCIGPESKLLPQKKRRSAEAFQLAQEGDKSRSPNTVPLLVWSGQPNDDDYPSGHHWSFTTAFMNDLEEDKGIVGWPPIKTWRKKLLHGLHVPGCGMPRGGGSTNRRLSRNSNLYVKVKMEGVGIGRKVDLKLFNSYESLINTLLTMFAKYDKESGDRSNYVLRYLDKDGDWQVAGDVPWQIFVNSALRLEILKQGGGSVDLQKSWNN